MARTLADTIREITKVHLNNGGMVLGQALMAVGRVNGTIPPNCPNVVELPMCDVAGAGIAVGAAIAKRRPIFILRFQDFLFLNSSPIFSYAAKTEQIFGVGTPIFIRAIADENHGLGIVHSACLHSIAVHMPGMLVNAPMTPKEYEQTWREFMRNDMPMFVSEHKRSFGQANGLADVAVKGAEITIYAISAARYSAFDAVAELEKEGIRCNLVHIMKLKPFGVTPRLRKPLEDSRLGLVVDSDYEMAGVSEHIANVLLREIGIPVWALGRCDKSLGIGQHLENATPQPPRIAEVVRLMLKNKKRGK